MLYLPYSLYVILYCYILRKTILKKAPRRENRFKNILTFNLKRKKPTLLK